MPNLYCVSHMEQRQQVTERLGHLNVPAKTANTWYYKSYVINTRNSGVKCNKKNSYDLIIRFLRAEINHTCNVS